MNKPVAWMFRGYLYEEDPSSWTIHEHPDVPVIPLYTHPVELTDEEIEAIMYTCDWSYDPVSFAKAILRKAQEK